MNANERLAALEMLANKWIADLGRAEPLHHVGVELAWATGELRKMVEAMRTTSQILKVHNTEAGRVGMQRIAMALGAFERSSESARCEGCSRGITRVKHLPFDEYVHLDGTASGMICMQRSSAESTNTTEKTK